MEAHVLALNDFSRPKVFDKSDAEYVNIVYLLLLSKGTFQSHPNMGVGIRERYRFDNSEALLSILKDLIAEVLEGLKPREREVIILRFGLNGGTAMTLDEVGKQFNVTHERVRQIEVKALKKLRSTKVKQKLEGFNK